MEDTNTVFDLTTDSKVLLLDYITEIKSNIMDIYRLLDTEINYIIKLINNDLDGNI